MKYLKSRVLFIMLVLSVFGSILMPTGQAISANGDPYRIMDTTLDYAFKNSSLFLFQTDLNISTLVIADQTVIVNDSLIGTNKRLEQVTLEKFSNSSLNMTVNSYTNLTDNPSLALDQWTFQYNYTNPINNTLAGVINGGNYIPEDIFVDDLMQEDDSFAQAFIRFFVVNNLPFAMAFMFYEYIRSFRNTSNVTINSEQNNTEIEIIDKYDGIYNWDYNSSATLNDLTVFMSPAYQDWTLNQSISIDANISMNCYHVYDNSEVLISLNLWLGNNTNSSQNMQLIFFAHADSRLIDSTLLDCLPGFENLEPEQEGLAQNWIWIIIAVLSSVIGTVLIGLLIQRRSCDKFSKPLEHLACRFGDKYKK